MEAFNLKPDDKIVMPEISILIQEKHGKPVIEFRGMTANQDLIKLVLSAAYHNKPLIIMPKFTSVIQSLNSCVEKGILYIEDGEYRFTF